MRGNCIDRSTGGKEGWMRRTKVKALQGLDETFRKDFRDILPLSRFVERAIVAAVVPLGDQKKNAVRVPVMLTRPRLPPQL
jgi:hypothetical protein